MPRNPFDDIWARSPSQFTTPSSGRFDTGWQGGVTEDPPLAGVENWWHNRVDEILQDIEQESAPEWLDTVTYGKGAIAQGSNGTAYVSVQGGNLNNNPTTDDGTWWIEAARSRRGLGEPMVFEVLDADDLTENGFYALDPASSNIPISELSTIFVFGSQGSGGARYTHQIWGGEETGSYELYHRASQAGAWGQWRKIHTAGNLAVRDSTTDADNAHTPGFYLVDSGAANVPSAGGTSAGFLLANSASATNGVQIYYRDFDDAVFIRHNDGGTWSDWFRQVDSSFFGAEEDYSGDLNALDRTAMIHASGLATNLPEGPRGSLFQTARPDGEGHQMFITAQSVPDVYVRSNRNGGFWDPWLRLASLDDFNNDLAAEGYQMLPNGLIIQWGRSGELSPSSNGNPTSALDHTHPFDTASITFPISFPNACFLISAFEDSGFGNGDQGEVFFTATGKTTTGGDVRGIRAGGSTAGGESSRANYIAIGY